MKYKLLPKLTKAQRQAAIEEIEFSRVIVDMFIVAAILMRPPEKICQLMLRQARQMARCAPGIASMDAR
jgi:hypothetical protein